MLIWDNIKIATILILQRRAAVKRGSPLLWRVRTKHKEIFFWCYRKRTKAFFPEAEEFLFAAVINISKIIAAMKQIHLPMERRVNDRKLKRTKECDCVVFVCVRVCVCSSLQMNDPMDAFHSRHFMVSVSKVFTDCNTCEHFWHFQRPQQLQGLKTYTGRLKTLFLTTKWLTAEVDSAASNVKLILYSRSYRGGVEVNLYTFFKLEARWGSVVNAMP